MHTSWRPQTGRAAIGPLLAVALLMAACSGGDGEDNDAQPRDADVSEAAPGNAALPEEAAPPATPTPAPTATPAPPDPDSGETAYLFDPDEVRTYDITVSEENLAFLDADPAAEEYVEASLTFEGHGPREVGLRYKGSIGAWINCLEGTQGINLLGGEGGPGTSPRCRTRRARRCARSCP